VKPWVGLHIMVAEYAVIGWPLGHSMSPLIHNASFEALGLDCRFVARPLSPAEFEPFMKSLPASSLKGLAVTIPYKTEVLRYSDIRAKEVEVIGAANTISVRDNGELGANNTDSGAASRALREAGVAVGGRRVVVLGAGGASRAICFQMLWEKAASLAIVNRTVSRAERLRDELIRSASDTAVSVIPLEAGALFDTLETADVVINTTSVGMYPRVDECPIDTALLSDGCAVFDIVYNPVETKLLKDARKKGACVIPGADMLVYQAASQEDIWLGVDAPVEVMKTVLLKELSKGS
jgi:shikimate dehydrogenase